jgi:hypothetical protein
MCAQGHLDPLHITASEEHRSTATKAMTLKTTLQFSGVHPQKQRPQEGTEGVV